MFRSYSHSVKITNSFTAGDVQVFINEDLQCTLIPGETSPRLPVEHEDAIELKRLTSSTKKYPLSFNDGGKRYMYAKSSKGEKQKITVVYKSRGFSLLSWIRWNLTRGPDNIGVGPDEP